MPVMRREYLVTYRQRLTAKELEYVRSMRPLQIVEVTPAGWTRRLTDEFFTARPKVGQTLSRSAT